MKPTSNPDYLETRRQKLIRELKLIARIGSGRAALLRARRRQRALNLINRRLGV